MASLRSLLPGAVQRRKQVVGYAEEWRGRNEAALAARGPLWVALGDSAAQGVGATSVDRGYVGVLLGRMRAERDPSWRLVNLSASGARVADVLTVQLPRLATLEPVALVTCAVGGNDLLRTRWARLEGQLHRLLDALPPGAVLATMPRGLNERRARRANALIAAVAPARGLLVADLWSRTGPPWEGKYAADHFHPSDAGHADWAAAFAEPMGL